SISTMSVEVARLCKASMESAKVGTEEDKLQNGRDFYKFFFTNFPDLRVYFKGAEKFTADDVQKSERFEKQGQRLLLAVHILAETYANQEVFKAYVRETINRHRVYKMDPSLWLAFFTVFTMYLETKTKLDEETKKAWAEMGKVFNEEAQTHLKNSNLPHV
ncbi:glb-1, partial [Pristionchus pacificus]